MRIVGVERWRRWRSGRLLFGSISVVFPLYSGCTPVIRLLRSCTWSRRPKRLFVEQSVGRHKGLRWSNRMARESAPSFLGFVIARACARNGLAIAGASHQPPARR